jgi:hypothetical protein
VLIRHFAEPEAVPKRHYGFGTRTQKENNINERSKEKEREIEKERKKCVKRKLESSAIPS